VAKPVSWWGILGVFVFLDEEEGGGCLYSTTSRGFGKTKGFGFSMWVLLPASWGGLIWFASFGGGGCFCCLE